MSSPLEQAGAAGKPRKYASIHVGRFFTGMWTQRSPLREGATPYLYEKFYGGSRYDSLIDGNNVELTSKLTLARRPGLSVYNSATFPAVNRFYSWHIADPTPRIAVLADTASIVYNATAGDQTTLFTKTAGAGSSYFQSVGNTLYMGNGLDERKFTSTGFGAPNVPLTYGISSIVQNFGVSPPGTDDRSTLTLIMSGDAEPTAFIDVEVGQSMTISGASVSGYNGTFKIIGKETINNPTAHTWTCYLVYNAGASGLGDATGGSVRFEAIDTSNWGIVAPTVKPDNAPTGTLGSPCRYWAPGMQVQPGYSVLDVNGNVQVMTGEAAAEPTPIEMTLTVSGFSQPWMAYLNSSYSFGLQDGQSPAVISGLHPDDTVVITASGSVTNRTRDGHWFGPIGLLSYPASTHGGYPHVLYVPDYTIGVCGLMGAFTDAAGVVQQVVEVGTGDTFTVPADATQLQLGVSDDAYWDNGGSFQVSATITSAGSVPLQGGTETTGQSMPKWSTLIYGLTIDGTAKWTNMGKPASWQASTLYGTGGNTACVIDPNGMLQVATDPGTSGIAEPTWATTAGATTSDGTVTWLNTGLGQTMSFQGWKWVYSFANSSTQHCSTASPVSLDTGPVLGSMLVPLAGKGSDDPQVDQIWIFRTLDGGATYLYEGAIPNNGASETWAYVDTNADDVLNEFIEAPLAHWNDPPPDGIVHLTYHLGRVWGSVGTFVYYSRVADAKAGVPTESFPPANYFQFPTDVIRMWPFSQGMMVFTTSDVYLILGQGTSNSPLYAMPYIEGYGLLNYDAFCVNGTIIMMQASDGQVISFDPSSGISEIGFPIGDLLSQWAPTSTQLTWHVSGSADKALYISDRSTGWYRMSTTSAPETGLSWSPKATITNGCSAVQSVEIEPGVHRVLVAPKTTGAILKRDPTVFTDNGTAFTVDVTVGSLVLAQPGGMAELASITTDTTAVGSRPTVNVRLDEIDGDFESMTTWVSDPPLLPASKTLYGSRYYFSQTQQPAWCRHMQLQFAWPAEAAKNELLSYSLFGAPWTEI